MRTSSALPNGLPLTLLLVAAWLLAAGGLWPRLARADAIEAELTVLTTHVKSQRDAPVELYRRRLDSRGQNVLTPGIKLGYDMDLAQPFWRAHQVQFAWGEVSDSIEHRLGFLAVMARWVLWQGPRASASLELGPGFLYRESWRSVYRYRADNALHESHRFLPGYEWAVLPLGTVDLLYHFAPRLQGVWSIFPGFPYVIMQSVGVRWQF